MLDLRSAYVSIRQHTSEEGEEELVLDTLEETTRPLTTSFASPSAAT